MKYMFRIRLNSICKTVKKHPPTQKKKSYVVFFLFFLIFRKINCSFSTVQNNLGLMTEVLKTSGKAVLRNIKAWRWKFYRIFKRFIFMYVCVCLYVYDKVCMGTQKRELDLLGLEWQVVMASWCRYWELSSAPLQEQYACLTAKPSCPWVSFLQSLKPQSDTMFRLEHRTKEMCYTCLL